jgi:hypothetical protein
MSTFLTSLFLLAKLISETYNSYLISLVKTQNALLIFRLPFPSGIVANRKGSLGDCVAIRHEERKAIWTAQQGHELFPEITFNEVEEHMEETRLWQIVKKMPKGALLHAQSVSLQLPANSRTNTDFDMGKSLQPLSILIGSSAQLWKHPVFASLHLFP